MARGYALFKNASSGALVMVTGYPVYPPTLIVAADDAAFMAVTEAVYSE